ncbi:MAG TPA: hypothetical protein VF950_19815 [Planctomycetota bacterium]
MSRLLWFGATLLSGVIYLGTSFVTFIPGTSGYEAMKFLHPLLGLFALVCGLIWIMEVLEARLKKRPPL